jgi:hypothetical protein
LIVKTDDPRYHRDMYSNALIATDQQALLKHRQKVSQTNTIMSNENEINNLRYEINNIKKIVK